MAPQGVKPGTTAVEVIIREGRKNQVKRMLSKIHHPVIRLHRCNFAGLELKDVAKGSWRELTDREVQILKAGGIPPKQASSKQGDPTRQRSTRRPHRAPRQPRLRAQAQHLPRALHGLVSPPRPSACVPIPVRQPPKGSIV